MQPVRFLRAKAIIHGDIYGTGDMGRLQRCGDMDGHGVIDVFGSNHRS